MKDYLGNEITRKQIEDLFDVADENCPDGYAEGVADSLGWILGIREQPCFDE